MHKFSTVKHETDKGPRDYRVLEREGIVEHRQVRPMAKRYIVTDPFAIADRLSGKGWQTQVVDARGKRVMKATRWDAIVRFWKETDGHAGDMSRYGIGGMWLCNHSGRKRFAGLPGALRLSCLNQFPGAEYDGLFSWTHTDSRLQYILDNIASYSKSLSERGTVVFQRIGEIHRRVFPTRMADYFLNAIALHKPRLALQVAREFQDYRNQGSTLWAVAQSLTGVRSPTTQLLAQEALGNSWGEFKNGHVPAAWHGILN